MKSKITVGALLAALALAAIPARMAAAQELPTADDLIKKYIAAIGGEEAIKKIKSRVTKGKFALPAMSIEAVMTNYVAPPNVYMEINVESMGMVVKRGITDGVAWEVNPMQGSRILEGDEAADLKGNASMDRLVNYKDDFESLQVVGQEDVGDVAAYKVVAKPKNGGAEQSLFFDKETGLLVQQQTEQGGMLVTTTVGDYKDVDGVKIAHKMSSSGGMMDIEITFDSVEQNTEIDPATFALPEEIKALQPQQ